MIWKLRLVLSWFRRDTWMTFRDYEAHIPIVLDGHTAIIMVTEQHREYRDWILRRGKLYYTIRDYVVTPPHPNCRCNIAPLVPA